MSLSESLLSKRQALLQSMGPAKDHGDKVETQVIVKEKPAFSSNAYENSEDVTYDFESSVYVLLRLGFGYEEMLKHSGVDSKILKELFERMNLSTKLSKSSEFKLTGLDTEIQARKSTDLPDKLLQLFKDVPDRIKHDMKTDVAPQKDLFKEINLYCMKSQLQLSNILNSYNRNLYKQLTGSEQEINKNLNGLQKQMGQSLDQFFSDLRSSLSTPDKRNNVHLDNDTVLEPNKKFKSSDENQVIGDMANKQENLIDYSFKKILKPETQSFTPYKSAVSNIKLLPTANEEKDKTIKEKEKEKEN